MAEPLYRTQRSKRTGAVRDLVSHDGGQSWELDEGSAQDAAIDREIAGAGGVDAGPELKAATGGGAPALEDDPVSREVVLDEIKVEGDVPEKSIWDSLRDSARETYDAPLQTAGDAWKGLAQGFTRRWGDEGAAALTPELDDGTGIPRTYRGGSADADMTATLRRENAEAAERSPAAFHASEIAATLPGAIAAAPHLGIVGQGVAEGVIGASGASESDDPEQVARESIAGGLVGGVGGYAVQKIPGAAKWAGAALGKAATKVGAKADKLRLLASGASKADIDRLAQRSGGLSRYAGGAERMKIGGLGTADDYADDAARAQVEANSRKAALEGEIEASGAGVDPSTIAARVRALKSGHGEGSAGQPLRNTLDEMADEYEAMGGRETIHTAIDPKAGLQRGQAGRFEKTQPIPLDVDVVEPVPWWKVNLERKDLGKATNFSSDSPRQAVRSDVYGAVNDSMADAAEQATPGLGKAWRAANEDEHIAIELGDMARKKAAGDVGRSMIPNAIDFMAGAAGATAGPFIGVNPLQSGGAASMLSLGLRHGVRGREHALRAGLARAREGAYGSAGRGLQRAGEAAGRLTQAIPAGAAAGTAAASVAEDVPWSSLARASAQPAQTESDKRQERNRIAMGARGHMLDDAARQALQSNPEALGKYAQQIAEAADDEPVQLTNLLDRLGQDEEFQRTVLPELQQMTARR